MSLSPKVNKSPSALVKMMIWHDCGMWQPTNDLDLATVESLEGFLASYGGCLLVASHDRAFMEGLDRMFVLRGDGVVRLFEGSYSEVCTPSSMTVPASHQSISTRVLICRVWIGFCDVWGNRRSKVGGSPSGGRNALLPQACISMEQLCNVAISRCAL